MAGRQAIDALAEQHGFSPAAVISMLEAVSRGHGGMAQFDHPEFGGAGQWMSGGMVMASDLFDSRMKHRIDRLCSDLALLVENEPEALRSGSFQSQSQGQQAPGCDDAAPRSTDALASRDSASLVVPLSETRSEHWPSTLGQPDSTGAQNDVRYAYFRQAHRLAIELHGELTIYDTLDHVIDGFAQQQSRGGSLTFSSQRGTVDVASLPVVTTQSIPQSPRENAASLTQPPRENTASATQPPRESTLSTPARPQADDAPAVPAADVYTSIEKLGELYTKGLLTEEEFTAKKAELLARL